MERATIPHDSCYCHSLVYSSKPLWFSSERDMRWKFTNPYFDYMGYASAIFIRLVGDIWIQMSEIPLSRSSCFLNLIRFHRLTWSLIQFLVQPLWQALHHKDLWVGLSCSAIRVFGWRQASSQIAASFLSSTEWCIPQIPIHPGNLTRPVNTRVRGSTQRHRLGTFTRVQLKSKSWPNTSTGNWVSQTMG